MSEFKRHLKRIKHLCRSMEDLVVVRNNLNSQDKLYYLAYICDGEIKPVCEPTEYIHMVQGLRIGLLLMAHSGLHPSPTEDSQFFTERRLDEYFRHEGI